MLNAKLTTTLLAVALGSLSGCASTLTPELDSRFGGAVIAARAAQTINPDAALSTDPVTGIDGEAARETMDRYQRSFKTPPKPVNLFNIEVGTDDGGNR